MHEKAEIITNDYYNKFNNPVLIKMLKECYEPLKDYTFTSKSAEGAYMVRYGFATPDKDWVIKK